MNDDDELLLRARRALPLESEVLADLLGIPVDVLEAIERGTQELPPRPRLTLRKLLGLRLLSHDDVEQSPIAVLFRSAAQEVVPRALAELAADESLLTLGDFVSSQRDLTWLEAQLALEPRGQWLSEIEPRQLTHAYPADQGRQLAEEARQRLGLGEDPIPSVLSLLDALGVEVVWAAPETLSPDIEGASVLAPAPAVLINPKWGSDKWWRNRMTLAHELCHLLYDRHWLVSERSFFLLSPRRHKKHMPGHLRLFDTLYAIEQRASAFAAYFLAPPGAVVSTVAGMDPRSDQAILALCSRFGVGWDTAASLLRNCCDGVSMTDHIGMQARERLFEPTESFARDAPTPPSQPRRGRLIARVGDAMRADIIDAIDARVLLDLRMDDPLPVDLEVDERRRAPLRNATVLAVRHANIALFHACPERDLTAVHPTRADEGWALDVVASDDEGTILGVIRLSDDFEVVELPPVATSLRS